MMNEVGDKGGFIGFCCDAERHDRDIHCKLCSLKRRRSAKQAVSVLAWRFDVANVDQIGRTHGCAHMNCACTFA